MTLVCWAHPRSRGENRIACQSCQSGVGSSPLTREKPRSAHCIPRAWRLIPAHAGKTREGRTATASGSAHPRSRGENRQSSGIPPAGRGSSPLTRGKPSWRWAIPDVYGLIPAHAGKTKSDADPGRVERAHPRSRGENMYPSTYASAAAGSSPLTRGKRGRSSVRRRGRGLIPAHAGKTFASRRVTV